MRMTRAKDILYITISHNVSFMGKTWWTVMLVLRLLVVLLGGFTLFSDEQERFICNTIQPGCSTVCFDVFSPVSILRLWLFHLILLSLPHFLFATYVVHKLLSYPQFGAFPCDRSRGGSPPLTLGNSSSSLNKAPLHDVPREWAAPRFYCAYFFAVIFRILLEVVFGAGQFYLFGLSVPKSFLCYEAPCTSGVECYVSKPTEKTLMLNFMLGVAALSVLLSLVDVVSSVKAMLRWRRKTELLMEEMSKGEQSSMFTTTTVTEDSDAPLTRRISPGGSSADAIKDEKHNEFPQMKVNGGPCKTSVSAHEKISETKDAKADMTRSPTPMSTPVPTHFVPHSHLRPPLPLNTSRLPTATGVKKLGQCTTMNSGQQSDSSESQDKRAWV